MLPVIRVILVLESFCGRDVVNLSFCVAYPPDCPSVRQRLFASVTGPYDLCGNLNLPS